MIQHSRPSQQSMVGRGLAVWSGSNTTKVSGVNILVPLFLPTRKTSYRTYLSKVVWIPGIRQWGASMKTYQLSEAYNLTHHSLNDLFRE